MHHIVLMPPRLLHILASNKSQERPKAPIISSAQLGVLGGRTSRRAKSPTRQLPSLAFSFTFRDEQISPPALTTLASNCPSLKCLVPLSPPQTSPTSAQQSQPDQVKPSPIANQPKPTPTILANSPGCPRFWQMHLAQALIGLPDGPETPCA